MEGAILSAELSLSIVPFLSLLPSLLLGFLSSLFLGFLFRPSHPGGGFEAFAAVLAVNGVHDMLHLGPSAAFHERAPDPK